MDQQHNGQEDYRQFLNSMPNESLEIIDDFKYDTQQYIEGNTTHLTFFNSSSRGNKGIHDTNMDIPGMLPQPQGMLVREICITGITKEMTTGISQFQIGNKRYREVPLLWYFLHNVNAWTLSVPLFIAPLQMFKMDLFWAIPVAPKKYRTTLRCAMYGQIARPVC